MFNKVKIGSKLTGGFLIVSLIAALIGIVGFVHIVEIGDQLRCTKKKIVN